MNLTRIQVHQLGQKIGDFRSTEQEFLTLRSFAEFMLWQTTHPLDFPINPLVITTLYLVEVDEDGHPEITEATVLVPTWTDEQQSLIMQGYGMAMEHLGRFMDAEAETDHERVEGIYELLNDNERAFMNGDGWEHITSDLPWIE